MPLDETKSTTSCPQCGESEFSADFARCSGDCPFPMSPNFAATDKKLCDAYDVVTEIHPEWCDADRVQSVADFRGVGFYAVATAIFNRGIARAAEMTIKAPETAL